MVENNKEHLYKIKLGENIQVYEEDCFNKCNRTQCIEMYEKNRILNECIKCNQQENKCFKKSIIGGVCDSCNGEEKINCYDIHYFGCNRPDNINDFQGVKPYYIEIPDNHLNSPYEKKCVFCWILLDNI